MSARGYARAALGYCSNVHAGETLEAVEENLRRYLARVREARGLPEMAAGLWLAHEVVMALAEPGTRAAFRDTLQDAGIRLHTLNAFPYGGFHAERVKEGAFLPDWSDERRLRYTLACAQVLADCLPENATEGTVSTVPLGLRAAWSGEKENAAIGHLLTAVQGLDALAQASGRPIRLCLEPEPGATLERTEQVVAFYEGWLLPAADVLNVPRERVARHLGICYDVCHQAILFERPADSLAQLIEADIPIGKIQLSCALEAPDARAREQLRRYAEPRYLHQVRAPDADRLLGTPDLDDALADPRLAEHTPWRVHFHVPIDVEAYEGGLRSTQAELLEALDVLAAQPALRPHLEVETYTRDVLPAHSRAVDDEALVNAIARELTWAEGEMQRRGLLLP